ncbi:hypothetical protein [Streptomyces lavendulae]|uniref:hypothetical protein n=1 Tax=Streptomyces lavendulae TaxID=1914 RepID=UPI0024A066B9|nr:hypothetical protein [Streptomyces lavendulae]GLV97745.1 hypothetical protein Slala05_13770 [Streptomyces lavendulae subsp. lavendulae]
MDGISSGVLGYADLSELGFDAHVLSQVIEAYTRVHRPEKLCEIRPLRPLAGLGTISDVMPVLYENRRLVADAIVVARLLRVAAPKAIPKPWGGSDADPDALDIEQSILMQLLRTEPHHPVFLRVFDGFGTVLKTFAQVGKIRDVDDRDEGFFGFYVAPAMNSSRRTGSALEPCFAVFTAGLSANRTVGINGHPVVVVNRPAGPDDFDGGSGRAPRWFDITTSLEQHDGLSAIGHRRACVVRVAKVEKPGDLVAVLQETAQVALLAVSTDGPKGDLVLGPDADCDDGLEGLRPLFEPVRRTEGLTPFGHGLTTPVVEIAIEPLGPASGGTSLRRSPT